ncbi:inorganic phosphate transporter [Hymenobacter chitinivorans]|uniref:Phosphate transporter n=1 Tax=Hymenobacter chitinivorans DSM 11115 TaxID=1121954 RepID=A0A2M9AQM5_9BACT|nr:inorganic phosphate transporter [Hymenobacter chitinivorans]PJJ48005.1 PiT family inorganic phosphate transporter [Hymenobacter chitinivorans DSM 11115]
MLYLLFLAVLLLTYSNGANDNFKGVATLWGSGTLAYRPALVLATVATFAGSVCSYFFASELVQNFSGKGLVPDDIIQSTAFILAVALAAGITVLLATRLGFPISTTHGLVGALVGAGLVAVGPAVNFAKLGTTFFLPLILGPVLAVGVGSAVYLGLRRGRQAAGITQESCVCVGSTWVPVAALDAPAFAALPGVQTTHDTLTNCQSRYQGTFFGLSFQPLINNLHYLSAAAVSFARGLNDTPKLVGLLLVCRFFSMPVNVLLLAVAMAVGGLLNARSVADTMSKKISSLNHGQGFTANMVTSLLVIFASKLGLPVSTTHVSVGSIYGIGLVNKTANSREIARIGLSWVLTLPVAALLSATLYFLIHTFTT